MDFTNFTRPLFPSPKLYSKCYNEASQEGEVKKNIVKIITLFLVLSATYSCQSLQRDPAQLTISPEAKKQCIQNVKAEYNSYFEKVENCIQP